MLSFLKSNIPKAKEVHTEHGFSLVTITEGDANEMEEPNFFHEDQENSKAKLNKANTFANYSVFQSQKTLPKMAKIHQLGSLRNNKGFEISFYDH